VLRAVGCFASDIAALPQCEPFLRLQRAVSAIASFQVQHPGRYQRITDAYLKGGEIGDAEWSSLVRECRTALFSVQKAAGEEVACRYPVQPPGDLNPTRLAVAWYLAGVLQTFFGVLGVYLAGSVARGQDDERSDIDLVLHVLSGRRPKKSVRCYFADAIRLALPDAEDVTVAAGSNILLSYQGQKVQVVPQRQPPSAQTGFEGAFPLVQHAGLADMFRAWARSPMARPVSDGVLWTTWIGAAGGLKQAHGLGALPLDGSPYLFVWSLFQESRMQEANPDVRLLTTTRKPVRPAALALLAAAAPLALTALSPA